MKACLFLRLRKWTVADTEWKVIDFVLFELNPNFKIINIKYL